MPNADRVTIEYDNKQIGQLDSSGDATLITRGKKCESDIKVKLRKYPVDTGFKLHIKVVDPISEKPEDIEFTLMPSSIGLNPNTHTYMMTEASYTGSANYDLVLPRLYLDGHAESPNGYIIISINNNIHARVFYEVGLDAAPVDTVKIDNMDWFIIRMNARTSETTVLIFRTEPEAAAGNRDIS